MSGCLACANKNIKNLSKHWNAGDSSVAYSHSWEMALSWGVSGSVIHALRKIQQVTVTVYNITEFCFFLFRL